MTAQQKRNFGIVAMILLILVFAWLEFMSIAQYYTSRFGEQVKCRVVDNSHACKKDKKYVKVSYNGDVTRVMLYGNQCRSSSFPLNKFVTLRRNERFDLLVPNFNQYEGRF